MAQAQVVDQAALQSEGENTEGEHGQLCHHRSHTHQLVVSELWKVAASTLEDSMATFNTITNYIYFLLLESAKHFHMWDLIFQVSLEKEIGQVSSVLFYQEGLEIKQDHLAG